MKSTNLFLDSPPSHKCDGTSDVVDVEKKILKISLDNPYFSKPIKMIQNLKDVNISKESIYKFYHNLKNEKIINCPSALENEIENQLTSVLFDFISNFNEHIKKPETKSNTFEDKSTQNELFYRTDQDESQEETHKGIFETFETLESHVNEQIPTTQENLETQSQTEKKDIVQKINEFLKLPEFSPEKEVKILENDEIKNFLELHSNNECFKEAITPILKDNYWQINFPSWADKVESFSSEQIIATLLEIIMVLIYHYYKIAIIKVLKTEEQKAIKEINSKYTSLDNYSAFPPLYEIIMKKAFSPPKGLLCVQLEEYLQSHNIKRDETIDTTEKCKAFIEDILNEFKTKNEIKLREKMKQFFEKITYIYIYNFKENKYKYIVYYYLRVFIIEFTPFKGLTNEIINIANKFDKMNEKNNKYKEIILQEIKAFISLGLKKDFTLNFVDYGSHYTNLNLPESDLDFRLFYKEKDEMNPVYQNEFILKLFQIFEIMKKKKIEKLSDHVYYLNIRDLIIADALLFKLEYYIYNIYHNEWIIVKIDLTFEKDIRDEKGINYSEEIIKKRNKQINDEIAKNPWIRKTILVIKELLKHFGMNSTYYHGISSYISSLLYCSSVKMFKDYFDNNNLGVQFLLFLNKFSQYQYNYYIDKNGIDQFLTDKEKDYFVIKNPKYGNNENNKRFFVDDPVLIEHSNAAYKCYDTENVKYFFLWLFWEIICGNNITKILNEHFLFPKIGWYFLNKRNKRLMNNMDN